MTRRSVFTVQRLQFKDAHNFHVITSIRPIQRKPEQKMRMRAKQVNKVGDASLTPIHCDCLLMDRSPNDTALYWHGRRKSASSRACVRGSAGPRLDYGCLDVPASTGSARYHLPAAAGSRWPPLSLLWSRGRWRSVVARAPYWKPERTAPVASRHRICILPCPGECLIRTPGTLCRRRL